jgi:pyruvate formate lyase activating enzyme
MLNALVRLGLGISLTLNPPLLSPINVSRRSVRALSQRKSGSHASGKIRCKVCNKRPHLISTSLRVCADCIRQKTDEALPHLKEAHERARSPFGLPSCPPKNPAGIPCNLCANECVIGVGETGFCGLRENVEGRLESPVNPNTALLYSYLDSHVTNCCSAWLCPAGTGAGYPKYACKPGPEIGLYNLAVFFYGCNFNCLFCQNASHKELKRSSLLTLKAFTEKVRAASKISCICYFGGSPEPQLPFALNASKRLREENPGRLLRLCFEWNGSGSPRLVRKAAELALVSGGNVKFDLKCWTPAMSLALSGVSNEKSYENFRMIAEEFCGTRRDVPVLTATTLLVPGYVDASEVASTAKFIADLDPNLPYNLLIFHPAFLMKDLPVTPYQQVVRSYQAARRHLHKVHVGNLSLVGMRSMDAFKATL